MEQRFSMVTLGVADLNRAVAFYEKVIGWEIFARLPHIVFFELSGFLFAVSPHADLAKDMNTSADDSGRSAYQGFALSHFVRSKEEVDELFSRLKDNGATIKKEPEGTSWGGYYFYFADPDGHCWCIMFTPHWTIQEDGRLSLA
jgi:uncharacterized glyoxalase superfamily protein PhnB